MDTPGKPWAKSASGTKHTRSFRVAQLNQPQTKQLRVHTKNQGKKTVVKLVPDIDPGEDSDPRIGRIARFKRLGGLVNNESAAYLPISLRLFAKAL